MSEVRRSKSRHRNVNRESRPAILRRSRTKHDTTRKQKHSDTHIPVDVPKKVTQQRLTHRIGLYAQGKQSTQVFRPEDLTCRAEHEARSREDLRRLLELANSRKRKCPSTSEDTAEVSINGSAGDTSNVADPTPGRESSPGTTSEGDVTPANTTRPRRSCVAVSVSEASREGRSRNRTSLEPKQICPNAPSRPRISEQPDLKSSEAVGKAVTSSLFPSLTEMVADLDAEFSNILRKELIRRAPEGCVSLFELTCQDLKRISWHRSSQISSDLSRSESQLSDNSMVSPSGVAAAVDGIPRMASKGVQAPCTGIVHGPGHPQPSAATRLQPPASNSNRAACQEQRHVGLPHFPFAGPSPVVQLSDQLSTGHLSSANGGGSGRQVAPPAFPPPHDPLPYFYFCQPEVDCRRPTVVSSNSSSSNNNSQVSLCRQTTYLFPVPVSYEPGTGQHDRLFASRKRNRELLARLQDPSDAGVFSTLDDLNVSTSSRIYQSLSGISPSGLGGPATPSVPLALVHDTSSSSDSPLWRPLLPASLPPAETPTPIFYPRRF